ncbi:hypothetical protein QBC37DRAFT_172501 [Rhypophila decipiens]|uniref:Uncharacterized protein n=1 Tax=Rhypophila decipiens TaxID=261697 RepID=A0AAN6Y8P5_9PEZI|nr:hypothetical protein QBC37DRAFT_172501 [Rhypophila decipiens]
MFPKADDHELQNGQRLRVGLWLGGRVIPICETEKTIGIVYIVSLFSCWCQTVLTWDVFHLWSSPCMFVLVAFFLPVSVPVHLALLLGVAFRSPLLLLHSSPCSNCRDGRPCSIFVAFGLHAWSSKYGISVDMAFIPFFAAWAIYYITFWQRWE